ncbi:MAG TPA: helix-turn-helix transcriptional regulator [Pseudonocardiaceae bacterium]|nr:helix-turn-helix transcriptional regulator [Pseudonocardiaceae bacterium]
MTAATTERPRLRELRTELGWTQQEMAERLAHLAWMQRGERVGVNADMVAKWERGAKGISPRYRELLCHLFGVTADQLGLKNTPIAEGTRTRTDDQSLLAMLDKAAGLLDQLGAAGTALAPHMLHAWKDAATSRRTMIGLLDPGATDPTGHARAATATVADLEQLAERYHDLYETADPAALLTSVSAHVRMAQDALHRDPEGQERNRRLRNLAEVAILAGRLAAEDLGNTMSGHAYYSLALNTAREAADDQLTAIAHGHAARLAAQEGMSTAALDHLTAASQHARSTPAVACWLATTEATIHADRDAHSAAHEALDRAHTALSTPGPAAPAWFRSWCPATTHVSVATSHVLLRAGDYSSAREKLTAALNQPGHTPRRQRVLILIDLATAELASGNYPDACAHATQAATLLHQVAHAFGAARLRVFRDTAQRPLPSAARRALDEHLSQIAA